MSRGCSTSKMILCPSDRRADYPGVVTLIDTREHELPIEEDDISATEPHQDLVARVMFGLRHRLKDVLVLGDMFIRLGRRQAAPDVFIAPGGGKRGARSIYRLEDEPVPEVTIEVLSVVNKHDPEGVAQVHRKRRFLGEIGVAEHIELDPIDGLILVHRSVNGVLEFESAGLEYVSERLGGVRFVVDSSRFEGIAVFDASGEEFEEADAAMARADAAMARAASEIARADAEIARADAESARAETERARADAIAERAGLLEATLQAHGIELPPSS